MLGPNSLTFTGKSVSKGGLTKHPVVTKNQGMFFDGNTYLETKDLVIFPRFSVAFWARATEDSPSTILQAMHGSDTTEITRMPRPRNPLPMINKFSLLLDQDAATGTGSLGVKDWTNVDRDGPKYVYSSNSDALEAVKWEHSAITVDYKKDKAAGGITVISFFKYQYHYLEEKRVHMLKGT
jgi:hypothetical protein